MKKLALLVLCTTLFYACTSSKPIPIPQPAAMKLVYSDEFDGNTLDATKWLYETGKSGWGNNELQDYKSSGNVQVSNGTLKIIAKKIAPTQAVGSYTSARLNSKKTVKYGKIEIRAKIPKHLGNGLWPAIWMLGDDISTVGWPKCGEIDIMEYVSYQPKTVFNTLHSNANNHTLGNSLGSGPISLTNAEGEFHTYGLLWTETSIKFYIDSPTNITYSANRPANPTNENWPFAKPHYFLLNMAVGGDWGGTNGVNDAVFPATLEIDYVRVYQ